MAKVIELSRAREVADTLLPDPILKLAVNAVLNNCPTMELIRCGECIHRIKGTWAKCTGRRPDDFCSDAKSRLHGEG